MSKLPPLPVDLNELSDRPLPGPIGGTSALSPFVPRKNRLDDMSKVVAEINSTIRRPSAPIPSNIANLEHVTSELGGLLRASAESMVTEAQNLLEQTKLWITNLDNEIKAKMAEHAELTDRLQAFGKEVLEAHKKYHGDKSQ